MFLKAAWDLAYEAHAELFYDAFAARIPGDVRSSHDSGIQPQEAERDHGLCRLHGKTLPPVRRMYPVADTPIASSRRCADRNPSHRRRRRLPNYRKRIDFSCLPHLQVLPGGSDQFPGIQRCIPAHTVIESGEARRRPDKWHIFFGDRTQQAARCVQNQFQRNDIHG